MTIQELMNLKGRRALITGAAGGLGTAMAETLAELGADLILVDRPGTDFALTVKEIKERWGVQIWHYQCDLEQNEQRLELLESIQKDHDSLNVLINNAAFVGTSELKGWGTTFEKQTIETWQRALEVNLTAPFHLCQSLAPLLRNLMRNIITPKNSPVWKKAHWQKMLMGNVLKKESPRIKI